MLRMSAENAVTKIVTVASRSPPRGTPKPAQKRLPVLGALIGTARAVSQVMNDAAFNPRYAGRCFRCGDVAGYGPRGRFCGDCGELADDVDCVIVEAASPGRTTEERERALAVTVRVDDARALRALHAEIDRIPGAQPTVIGVAKIVPGTTEARWALFHAIRAHAPRALIFSRKTIPAS